MQPCIPWQLILRPAPKTIFSGPTAQHCKPGFIPVYQEGKDDVKPDDDKDEKMLPELVEGERLTWLPFYPNNILPSHLLATVKPVL